MVIVPLSFRNPRGRVTLESHEDAHVLRLAGDIDADTVAVYEQELRQFGATVIKVVDLTAVTFLDSSGVAFLIRQTQRARERGHLPALRGLCASRARRILQLTGATRLFECPA
jgi:anti-anti-sigma factor